MPGRTGKYSAGLPCVNCRMQNAASSDKSGCNTTFRFESLLRSLVCRCGRLTGCAWGVARAVPECGINIEFSPYLVARTHMVVKIRVERSSR